MHVCMRPDFGTRILSSPSHSYGGNQLSHLYCCQNCSSNRLPSAFAFHICSFWHITSFKKTKFSLLTFFQRHHFHHLHVPEHSADGIWQKKVFIQKYHFICKKCGSGLEGRNRTQSGQTPLSKILNLWNHHLVLESGVCTKCGCLWCCKLNWKLMAKNWDFWSLLPTRLQLEPPTYWLKGSKVMRNLTRWEPYRGRTHFKMITSSGAI